MPVIQDIGPVCRATDATVTVAIDPPVLISGFALQFQVMHRFGGISGLINKYAASGFNNVSGINVTNAANGQFTVSIGATDTSGLDYGNFAYRALRTTSGSQTVLSEGFLVLVP